MADGDREQIHAALRAKAARLARRRETQAREERAALEARLHAEMDSFRQQLGQLSSLDSGEVVNKQSDDFDHVFESPIVSDMSHFQTVPVTDAMVAKPRTSGDFVRPDGFNPAKECWRDYADRYGEIAKWNGWDDQAAARYFRLKLSGEPLNILKRQSASVQSSWSALSKAFESVYCEPGARVSFQAQFDSFQRKPDEVWAEVAQRLRSVAERAFDKSSVDKDPLFDTVLLARFLKLLPLEIYRVVALRDYKTVEDAAEAAMRVDVVHGKSVVNPVCCTQTSEESRKLDELIQLMQRSLKSSDKVGEGRGTTPKKSKGRGRDKPSSGVSENRRADDQRSVSSSKKLASIQCFRCKGYGHFMRNCPTPASFDGPSVSPPESSAETKFNTESLN